MQIFKFFFFRIHFSIALVLYKCKKKKKKSSKKEKYQQCLSFEKRICSLVFKLKGPPDCEQNKQTPTVFLLSARGPAHLHPTHAKLFKSHLSKVHLVQYKVLKTFVF